MIPKIIHQVWFGGPMPMLELRCVQSVRHHNVPWTHMLWTEELAYRLLRADAPFWRPSEPYSSLSNWVRLLALRQFGGIYLDADCECLRPLNFFREQETRAFAAKQDEVRICNAVMGAEPESEWIKWQIDHWGDYDQNDPASGVYLATAAPRELVTLITPHLVYPFSYETPDIARRPHEDSYIQHWWSGSWTK